MKLLIIVILAFEMRVFSYSVRNFVPVNIIFSNNLLYFTFEKPQRVFFIKLEKYLPIKEKISLMKKREEKGIKDVINIWTISASSSPVEMDKIMYGQEIKGFNIEVPPLKLKKNVKYHLRIGISGDKPAEATTIFYIDDSNKVIILKGKDK